MGDIVHSVDYQLMCRAVNEHSLNPSVFARTVAYVFETADHFAVGKCEENQTVIVVLPVMNDKSVARNSDNVGAVAEQGSGRCVERNVCDILKSKVAEVICFGGCRDVDFCYGMFVFAAA